MKKYSRAKETKFEPSLPTMDQPGRPASGSERITTNDKTINQRRQLPHRLPSLQSKSPLLYKNDKRLESSDSYEDSHYSSRRLGTLLVSPSCTTIGGCEDKWNTAPPDRKFEDPQYKEKLQNLENRTKPQPLDDVLHITKDVKLGKLRDSSKSFIPSHNQVAPTTTPSQTITRSSRRHEQMDGDEHHKRSLSSSSLPPTVSLSDWHEKLRSCHKVRRIHRDEHVYDIFFQIAVQSVRFNYFLSALNNQSIWNCLPSPLELLVSQHEYQQSDWCSTRTKNTKLQHVGQSQFAPRIKAGLSKFHLSSSCYSFCRQLDVGVSRASDVTTSSSTEFYFIPLFRYERNPPSRRVLLLQ